MADMIGLLLKVAMITYRKRSLEVYGGGGEVVVEYVLTMEVEEPLGHVVHDHPLTRFGKRDLVPPQ